MRLITVVLLCSYCAVAAGSKKNRPKEAMPNLDDYVNSVNRAVRQGTLTAPGSIYTSSARLADPERDLRASQTYDLVYIVVSDKASAVSSGVTNTDRKTSAKASVTALGGAIKATKPLSNLANMSGETQLQGQGRTSRDSTLTTTLTAEVISVLPNGNLVVQ